MPFRQAAYIIIYLIGIGLVVAIISVKFFTESRLLQRPKFCHCRYRPQQRFSKAETLPPHPCLHRNRSVERHIVFAHASRKLIADIDHKDGPLFHLRLIDPSDGIIENDPNTCINADLVREGLASMTAEAASISRHIHRCIKNFATPDRAGMFEFGDVEEDDEGFY
ncbi:hypothetical protein M378DRAFT_13973 [Amanita muscaria Koide BX008]|uniref:Uncharacterized protein n=1 Tax=Amanita muscaria (strain Koide BX008) TaxID=946122 RepID=A0A0C2WVA2_AMAMK|nr:hypothetical protein M378DRAFT_13973 [Amanita muscaria Koide BX008]